jgi:hypothetical protein
MMATTNKRAAYRYADRTDIPAGETVFQIQDMLEDFDAGSFLQYSDKGRGVQVLGFQTAMGTFLVYVPLPDPARFPESAPPKASKANATQRRTRSFKNAFEQEMARRLRIVFALIRMKLIATEEGVTTLEREFFSDLVVVDNDGRRQTVYEYYAPQVKAIAAAGGTPPLLPGYERVAGHLEGKR